MIRRRFQARRASTAALLVTVALWASAFPTSVAPPRLAASARAQIDVLTAIRESRTPVQRKIDTTLYLALLHHRADPRLAPLTDFRFAGADNEGRLDVELGLSSAAGVHSVVEWLRARGAALASVSAAHRSITARVRFDDLEPLAELPVVQRVRRQAPAVTHAIDVSEGVATHLAAAGRDAFGATGAGVKVCVLSNGVDSLAAAQSTGDLPAAVEVLAGQAGSGDEGTAMLEVIHDIAPDATLAFATAVSSEAQFAQNILDLAATGCQVMVDDVTFPSESPFQDGPVAQAVDTVAAAGVLYFSAAGDDGNVADGTSATWEGDFRPNGTVPALAGAGNVHDFGDGGQSILVTETAESVAVAWAEHTTAGGGAASTDYDVYIMDGSLTTVFDASTNVQDGDDAPLEIAGQTFIGERIVVASSSTPAPNLPMFRLLIARGRLDPGLATGGATFGHSTAAGAISVAAAPATPPGPFPGPFTGASPSATFTSDGPRRIVLNPDGSEITPGNRTSTGGIVRQKPDLTAAEGVSTTVTRSAQFSGTSASAPHAAAIAALIRSVVPTATSAAVKSALVASAIDIDAPGVDAATGAGIVMTGPALAAAGATGIATLQIGALAPTQLAGDGDAALEPNEVWDFTIPLSNSGASGATTITATLGSPGPGATVLSGTSTYADLAPGASAGNATPFRVRVDSGTCAATVTLPLAVAYAGGSVPNRTFDITFKVGGPGTPVVYSYAGPEVPIPDGLDSSGDAPGTPAVAQLPISGQPGNVWDIDLRIDGDACTNAPGATTVGITHTFASDLRIGLVAPDGTSVPAISNAGGSGNNFCQTLLDDESTGPNIRTVSTGNAPFTGSFRPASPLSAVDGQTIAGVWGLSVQDFQSQDTGAIRAWSIQVTSAVCDAPALVNLPPTVLTPPNQTTPRNQAIGPIGFTVGDDLLFPAQLLVSATSSNQSVVASSGLAIGGSGAARTLTMIPVANASGSTTITLGASDGVSIGTGTFMVTVIGPNEAPTISPIPAQTVPENGTLAPVPFTIGDDTTAPGALVVTAESSNVDLVPSAALVLGGSGATRTVAATPLPNQDGQATITVTVSDGEASAATSFLLTVSSAPVTPPHPPRDLTASARGATVHLAWTPAGGGSPAARYVVESSATPLGTTLPIATVDAAQQTFVMPLAQGTYFFRVRAQNDAGMSPPSNEAIATVGVAGMPGPPTALRAAIAGSQVSLSWQRPAAGPDQTEYRIELGSGIGRTDLGVFDTGATATTIAAPVPDGFYVVRVKAKVGAAVGAASNEIAFRIGATACTAAPAPPVLLSPSVDTRLVTLSWLQPATGEPTTYRLSAGTAPGVADLIVFDTGSSATSIAVGTPGPGTYYLFAQADNGCGLSAASNTIAVVVPPAVPAPAAPQALTAAVAGHAVTLAWLPPAGGALPSHYLLEAGSGPGLADYGVFPYAFSAGPTSITIEGAPPASYYLRVRSLNAGGAGPASNEVIVTVR